MTTTDNSKRNRIIRIIVLIIIIIIILLLLKCCGKNKEIDDNNSSMALTPEQSILQKMKEDESYLFSLYDSSNICEKDWIKDYRNIGKTFTKYKNEYIGSNNDIKNLLLDYEEYGKKIEDIAISIDESNIEEGITKLEELIDTAKTNETELQRLYDEEFNKR